MVKFLDKIENAVHELRLLNKAACAGDKISEDVKHIRTAVFKDILPAFKSVPHIIKECKHVNPKTLEGLATYQNRFNNPVGEVAVAFHAVTSAPRHVSRLKVDVQDIIHAYDIN